MSRYEEALAFLSDPARVTLYTNAERASAPCPECGAEGKAPCIAFGNRRRRDTPHDERIAYKTPRSDDEQRALVEALARRYARGTYPAPLASYGPGTYPIPRWARATP